MVGDTLDPDEITRLLECSPTDAYRKGDILSMPSGREFTAPRGYWSLDASDSEPGDLNSQIVEIFDKLPGVSSVWESLGKSFELRLNCGLFTREWNESIAISSENLACLGSRGIALTFELYTGPMPTE